MAADPEIDEAEAKKQRKAARRAAKEAAAAAAADEEEAPVKEKKAKGVDKASEVQRLRKMHEDALAADLDEEDAEAAKRQRKAAKRAAKEAAAAATGEGLAEDVPEKSKKPKRPAEADDAKSSNKRQKLDAATEGCTNDLKVFIKGLPYAVGAGTLRKDFEECGEITEFKMPVSEDGHAKGFAFIAFATEEGFAAALKFDSTDYHGRYLNVTKAADKDVAIKGKRKEGDWTCPSCADVVFASKSNCRKCGTAKPGGGEDNENTVFIRGLPWAVTEEALRKDFSDCGEIVKLSLPKTEAGQPKGISFIKYQSQEGVDAALKFDNTEYGGRTIFVSIAGEAPPGKGKGKDGKGKGKGKGKDGKGKGKSKEGKKFVPTAAFATKNGCIVEGAGSGVKTFADSDEE